MLLACCHAGLGTRQLHHNFTAAMLDWNVCAGCMLGGRQSATKTVIVSRTSCQPDPGIWIAAAVQLLIFFNCMEVEKFETWLGIEASLLGL